MNRSLIPGLRLALKLLVFSLLASPVSAISAPASAPNGGLKRLPMELAGDRRSAEVKVPQGFGQVTLQQFQRDRGWRNFATRKATGPGIVRFKLPANGRNIHWRAIGRFQAAAAQGGKRKFPTAFLSGENRFSPVKSTSAFNIFQRADAGIANPAPEASGDAGSPAVPVESDIWKTDGHIVYFFNQLRGLQVLDLTDPSDPRLIASLRMPAVGEDLYLLPGSGDTRTLILLTRHYEDGKTPVTRIHQVEVTGGTVRVAHRAEVRGNLADSRIMGGNLILATTEELDWHTWGGLSRCLVSDWSISAGRAPEMISQSRVDGHSPMIAAGPDWLAVASTPRGKWGVSEVTVFGYLRQGGGLVRLTHKPLRTAGYLADKFKMQWSDNVLTTISEHNTHHTGWRPVTVLENFRVWGADQIRPAVITDVPPLLARLELAKGESLFATRFAGNKAYIVTFLQTDPLWVVDLSNPGKPVVAGHLEVPGWSTHLEPIGDMLFSIGWESNTVAASLFDVSDPANPTLVKRINLGEPGSFSEALWDEKALKVLPDDQLAMIPLSYYSGNGQDRIAGIQLLDVNAAARHLETRGFIPHSFDARRSAVMNGSVVSISQRVMVTADISDRDAPAISSEVTLAWPVDRVIQAGDFLLQIESGGHFFSPARASVRVSPASDTEAILSETDLGDGRVVAADLRDGYLFVLRQLGASPWYLHRSSPVIDPQPGLLALDVLDATTLPSLTLLGSCKPPTGPSRQVIASGLLWPRANRPAVLLQADPWSWFGPWNPGIAIPLPVASSRASIADMASLPVTPREPWKPLPLQPAPRLLVFDVSQPALPRGGALVPVGVPGTRLDGPAAAADGLVVAGTSDSRHESTGRRLPQFETLPTVRVIEVPESGMPTARPGIDLPGRLEAITELDRNGFLAYTRSWRNIATRKPVGPTPIQSMIDVSACDGHDAYRITGIEAGDHTALAAAGRRLFIARPGGVDSYELSDQGLLVSGPSLSLGWQPYALRWLSGRLLAANWNRLGIWDPENQGHRSHPLVGWGFDLENIISASDGSFLLPLGDFGIERVADTSHP